MLTKHDINEILRVAGERRSLDRTPRPVTHIRRKIDHKSYQVRKFDGVVPNGWVTVRCPTLAQPELCKSIQ